MVPSSSFNDVILERSLTFLNSSKYVKILLNALIEWKNSRFRYLIFFHLRIKTTRLLVVTKALGMLINGFENNFFVSNFSGFFVQDTSGQLDVVWNWIEGVKHKYRQMRCHHFTWRFVHKKISQIVEEIIQIYFMVVFGIFLYFFGGWVG